MIKFLIYIFLACWSTIGMSSTLIEYTVHHAPGGVSDRVTRLITKELPSGEYITQNRPGGAGRIAVNHILKNNSVLMATVTQIFVTNPLSFTDLEYNPNEDLEILGTVGVIPNLLVCNTKTGISNVSTLINTKKSLSFATSGYGSSDHIATELLFTHLKGKHIIVPYSSGGNKSTIDVLGGSVDCTFGNYATVKPIMKDDRIITLFSSHNMGDTVPTWENYFKETFPYQSFISLVVSKNMDQEKKIKIIKDVTNIWKKKEFKELMFNTGILPILNTEKWSTNMVIKSNQDLRKFITNNNIPLGH